MQYTVYSKQLVSILALCGLIFFSACLNKFEAGYGPASNPPGSLSTVVIRKGKGILLAIKKAVRGIDAAEKSDPK